MIWRNVLPNSVKNKLGTGYKVIYNTKFLEVYMKVIGPRAQVQRRWVGGSRNKWENKKSKTLFLDESLIAGLGSVGS